MFLLINLRIKCAFWQVSSAHYRGYKRIWGWRGTVRCLNRCLHTVNSLSVIHELRILYLYWGWEPRGMPDPRESCSSWWIPLIKPSASIGEYTVFRIDCRWHAKRAFLINWRFSCVKDKSSIGGAGEIRGKLTYPLCQP